MDDQGNEVHRRPSRTGVEIGLIISVVGMLLGLAFNAGIQYAHVSSNSERIATLESVAATQHDAQLRTQGQTDVRLGNIETMLHVIQGQQDKLQTTVETKALP